MREGMSSTYEFDIRGNIVGDVGMSSTYEFDIRGNIVGETV